MEYKHFHIVITGATSPVGISIINEWVKHNKNILAIIRPNSKNRKRLPVADNIHIVECNLEDLDTLDSLNYTCDIFYHIAWKGTNKSDRLDCMIQCENIAISMKAVQLAKKWQSTTFIGAGSQAEYGRIKGIINETTKVDPDTAYGIAKYAVGKLTYEYCKSNGIKFIWGRIFSAYGLYDGSNTLIMSLLHSLLANAPMALTKCEQQWDYINYKDVGRAFYLMALYGENGIYCIASGNKKPLIEYIKLIQKCADTDIQLGIGEIPYTCNQVMSLDVDISRLKNIGFEIKVSFEEGINELIAQLKTKGGNTNEI